MEHYRSVEVPKDTASYVAISHGSLVDSIYEHLDKAGFVVKDETIQLAKHGNQMFGTVVCKTPDTEQDMTIFGNGNEIQQAQKCRYTFLRT